MDDDVCRPKQRLNVNVNMLRPCRIEMIIILEAGLAQEGGDQTVDLLTQDMRGDEGLGLEGGVHPLKRYQSRGRGEAIQPLGRSK